MKQGLITEINTMEDAIESLKELYIKISNQRNLFINKEQDMQSNTKYKNLTKEMLDNIIGKKDETDNRKIIQFLKNIIEDILENEPNQEIKQKLEGIFGTYYISLRNKIEKLIKPQKGEEIVLDLIRQSEVKIHDDKSPKEDAIYGDLIQENEQTPEIIYKDKNMMLIRLNKYI